MSVLSRVAQDLPEVLGALFGQCGFVPEMEDEHRLSLRSPHCIIDIAFERYDYGFWVQLSNPREEQDQYDYLFVMTMRHPGYRRSVRGYDDSLSEVQNLRLDLKALRDDLVRYCPDLLAGDFASIRQEGYHEFAAYIKDRMPVVLNMPANDPIKVKFWQGDFTWARDLQEREQREG